MSAAATASSPVALSATAPARPSSARLAAAAGRLGLDASLITNLLCCPITQEPLADPVLAADGQTYERAAMEGGWNGMVGWWLMRQLSMPLGRPSTAPATPTSLRMAAHHWCSVPLHLTSSPTSHHTDWIARELAAGRPPCSPLTGAPLAELSLRPNLLARGMVEAFAAAGLL